jgi:hypothetical protein
MARLKKHMALPVGLTRKRAAKAERRVYVSMSSLDWYKLTESTRHVLNSLITGSARKQLEERLKENPDHQRIENLRALSKTIVEISRDPKVFESKTIMQEVLAQYAGLEVI